MGRKTTRILPSAAKRALRTLGNDLRDARRRRRIPTALMAERVGVTKVTLAKAERGEGTVSIGVYATMLFVLGLLDRLAELGSPEHDPVGLGNCFPQGLVLYVVEKGGPHAPVPAVAAPRHLPGSSTASPMPATSTRATSTAEEIEARNVADGRDPKQGYDNFERELTDEQKRARSAPRAASPRCACACPTPT